MELKEGQLHTDQVRALLQDHLNNMAKHSPEESRHALDLSGLQHEDIRFWSLWQGEQVAGCGAIKSLSKDHCEIKSMKTSTNFTRRGVAARILQHIIDYSKAQNVKRLSLETGSMEAFEPAHQLYLKFGFEFCGPFADYREDPNSLFMTKTL